MTDPTRKLLLEIAHCPIAAHLVRHPEERAHPCAAVVHAQPATDLATFHLPEPWNGDLAHAPLLFISTNPAFSAAEEYPTGDPTRWPDVRLADFFTARFGGGQEPWTWQGRRARQIDGSYAPKDGPFWSQVSGKAGDILGRQATRGIDWALTEVVHCKSVGGRGVDAALSFCSQRYLDRVITASDARLLVCFGSRQVWPHLQRTWHLPTGEPLVGPVVVGGRARYVAFLEHPQEGSRHLSKRISPERLTELRTFIAAPPTS